MYSMDDSALLDVSSDDKTTIRETSQRLTCYFLKKSGRHYYLSHQKPGSETVNPTKNIYNDNIEAT